VSWTPVCAFDHLQPDRGAAAMVDGRLVALFRLSGTDEVFAVDNEDPFSGAAVIARGLVGDRGGVTKVTSPMYKQSFDLRTGRCLDDPTVAVATYEVRVRDGWVEVRSP
jgi:nitrite reductase (NADH) small subunit